jgi:hypothetical protein
MKTLIQMTAGLSSPVAAGGVYYYAEGRAVPI